MQAKRTRRSAEERFWEKVDTSAGPLGCWPWTASGSRDGYGQFSADGRGVRAHRFAYELLVGPIPEGLQLDHLCRNPGCVNPAHLEPVTGWENTMRGNTPAAINAATTLDNLLRDAQRRRALPPADVRRELREHAGLTQADLASVLGVGRPSVTRYETGAREPRGRVRLAYLDVLERLAGMHGMQAAATPSTRNAEAENLGAAKTSVQALGNASQG